VRNINENSHKGIRNINKKAKLTQGLRATAVRVWKPLEEI